MFISAIKKQSLSFIDEGALTSCLGLSTTLDSLQEQSGAHFLKVPIINGPVKLLLFTCKIEVFNSFASNMIELSVHETKWNSLLARTHAVILYISI